MPKRLWKYRLSCPHPTCQRQELNSSGVYPVVQQVLDIDTFYNMATEYLECPRCKRKVIAWSTLILDQLDVSHRCQFPAILTYQCACGLHVAPKRTWQWTIPAVQDPCWAAQWGLAAEVCSVFYNLQLLYCRCWCQETGAEASLFACLLYLSIAGC